MATLVAYDESEPARKALEYAIENHGDGTITALHVLNPPEALSRGEARMYVDWEGALEDQRERAEELFADAIALAEDHGVEIETETVVGEPAREVVDYASNGEFDHVVVGSHGRSGMSRVLLGSVAERIVRRAPIPVTVVR